jgi:hypothetical protein
LSQTSVDPALDSHVADIFVTFEPWLTLDGISEGEGVLVTAWRGGRLAKDAPAIIPALAVATSDWLSVTQPPKWSVNEVRGKIVVDIRIYDGLYGEGGTGQCVLRLRRCVIPLNSIL